MGKEFIRTALLTIGNDQTYVILFLINNIFPILECNIFYKVFVFFSLLVGVIKTNSFWKAYILCAEQFHFRCVDLLKIMKGTY